MYTNATNKGISIQLRQTLVHHIPHMYLCTYLRAYEQPQTHKLTNSSRWVGQKPLPWLLAVPMRVSAMDEATTTEVTRIAGQHWQRLFDIVIFVFYSTAVEGRAFVHVDSNISFFTCSLFFRYQLFSQFFILSDGL